MSPPKEKGGGGTPSELPPLHEAQLPFLRKVVDGVRGGGSGLLIKFSEGHDQPLECEARPKLFGCRERLGQGSCASS